ncbi:Bacterial Ig-like domain protein [compost metagenome]
MRKNPLSLYWWIFSLLLFSTACILGCASMKTPEGGPIDKTPPKVLKMEPKDLTTNFNASKIVITFDEYFNIQNEMKEFTISPELEKAPLLKKNQKRLEVVFEDSLEKNTTYTLNFGKAIADVNEGNILNNLTYAFSTGPVLDSLSIRGKVINTLTGKPEYDATVFIIPLSRDSIFGKKKAAILTSTDSSGNYALNHLKKDTYKIYAIKEKNGDKIYQQRNDEIGYIKDPIVLTKNIDSVNMGLFKELPEHFRILDNKFSGDGTISLIFNQQLINPEIKIINNKTVDESKLLRFSKTNDSLKIWLKDLSFDTIQVELSEKGNPIDTLTYGRDKKDTYTRNLLFTDNLESNALNPYRPLKLYFNFPLEKVDLSRIKLKEDTISRTNFTITKDSTDFLAYQFNYPWKKKANYNITFEEGAFTAIFNAKNKSLRKTLILGNTDDYGTYILNIEIPDTAKAYIVEVLNDKRNIITSYPLRKNTTISLINYKVAQYFTRIVYDDNKNGKWDTGSLKEGTQPEITWNNPQEIMIRANWTQNMVYKIPPKPEKGKISPDIKGAPPSIPLKSNEN